VETCCCCCRSVFEYYVKYRDMIDDQVVEGDISIGLEELHQYYQPILRAIDTRCVCLCVCVCSVSVCVSVSVSVCVVCV